MRRLAALIQCCLLTCLLALMPPGGVVAQEAGLSTRTIQCSPRLPPEQPWHIGPGSMSMEEVATHLNAAAPVLRIENVRQTAQAVPTVELKVARPPFIARAEEWRATWFEAVVYPASLSPGEVSDRHLLRGRVLPPAPGDEATSVTALLPGTERGWWPTRWEVALLACVDPNVDPSGRAANGRELRGFARQAIYVSSLRLSASAGAAAAAALYLVLALAALRIQSRQIEYARGRQDGGAGWAFGYALQPAVIAQDSFGVFSLSRFQVLLFTLTLTAVYAYVMTRTGELPNVSTTVLTLLGITLTGSTLARMTEGPAVDTGNRLWLLGTGVVDRSPRLPRWSDLITAEGEIDVTRVQALAFSLFAAAALLVNGTGDLENFEIPEQLNYLIGISQAVYVAGKALPHEAAKRLNEEVRTIREAEARVLADPADAAALRGFETARNGIGSTLLDVFGERFCAERLRGMQPGERLPPAPAPA